MLIRVNGASAGIKEYLETGQKNGRDFSRDELDERVILSGDLELTDTIINCMSNDGDRYLHITLAFKEDELNPETMKAIVGEFDEFAMTAFDQDEYNFYAEAHLPKIKSYVHQKSGELVERKPHIHIVIPEQNLLSGQHLNPFGKTEQQTKFIDSFQEHINAKYGLASPKDNRRIEYTSESEIISRYKGDVFQGAQHELKDRLLGQMLEKGIESFEDFQKLAAEHGQTRIRNTGTEREYLNVKPEGAARGVNLKEYVFSRKFVELPADQKRTVLSAEIKRQYDSPGQPKATDHMHVGRLDEWHEVRAKELKYINSGSRKFHAEYRAADRDTRRALLAERENRFYAKHRKDTDHDRTDDREFRGRENTPSGTESGRTAADIAANHRATDRDPGTASRNIESTGRVDRDPEHAAPKRSTDSVVGQMGSDLAERRSQASAGRDGELAEIKQCLDARRLLAHVSRTHGAILEKYEVTKGKDGADRIKCGTRNLNVSDFLTKEMNLPWSEAAPLMREAYAAQLGQEPACSLGQPKAELWKEYRATWPAKEAARRKLAWETQKASERERRAENKAEHDKQRRAIEADPTTKGADKKAAKSLARMEKVQADIALRAAIKHERDELRTGLKRTYAEQYRDFLTEKAQEGEEAALAELRRQRTEPERKDESTPRILGQESEVAPLLRTALRYSVASNGDVTYHDREGRALIQDTSREVRMLQTNDQTIEAGLRLAAQKFGKMLELNGDDTFKRRAVEVAVAAGLRIEFSDPDLNRYKAELMERQRPDAEQHRLSKEQLAESFQEVTRQAKVLLGDLAKTHRAQVGERAYSGPIIAESKHHVLQRVSETNTVAHVKTAFAQAPVIDKNQHLQISYNDGKATGETVLAKSRARARGLSR